MIIHFILLFLLFLSPSISWAVEGYNSDNKQFSFAESLFVEGDYYRSITEFKRFIFFSPQDKLVEKATFRIAECFFKAKKWTEAVDAFSEFNIKYPLSPMAMEALYFKALSEKALKRHNSALSTFHELISVKSLKYYDKAIYHTALIFLEMEEWQKARQTFSIVPENSSLFSSSRSMSSGLEHIDDIPQKSPAAAGTLAAILPGSGHLYTERYRDAILAFLLNGAFIWAGIELFKHDNPVAGSIVTFFELGWYTGNIYSAVSSAHKYNKRVKEEFIQHLKDCSGFSFSVDPITSSGQLMFSFRY